MLPSNPLSLAEYTMSDLTQLTVPTLSVMILSYQRLRDRWREADAFCGAEIERLTREVHALRSENELLKKQAEQRDATRSGVYVRANSQEAA